ncbi:MAG: DegT/DnrJ/EryC1/StrS family aminotransferase [bacterium]|nr:MAG: DegT/DnrJ/EryC1/StrS family aminotransferase [bacterium]
MKVKLLDLVPQYERIKDEIFEAIGGVLSTQQFILGSPVETLEGRIADFCRVEHAVGCASGSDALLLALMALGVREGDEVITTPYTFFSTVSSITRLGARPVFADIDPATFNIDPASIRDSITARTKAVIVVHLFGQTADMDPILALGGERGVPVIEDACQAIGASYKGRSAGSMGSVGCFSFFPSKNLGGYGDGGMITTDDVRLAQNIRILRVHGSRERYFHDFVGINSRLDAIQAAVLTVKLGYLEEWNELRRERAAYYHELFSEVPEVTVPPVTEGNVPVFNQYVIRIQRRNECKAFCIENGIGCEIYYPVPLHLQKCFSSLGYREGDFPEAERASRETLALPIYPELEKGQQEYVAERITGFFQGRL